MSAACVDFSQVISLIRCKIQDLGIQENMFNDLLAVYHNVTSCVRVNGLKIG